MSAALRRTGRARTSARALGFLVVAAGLHASPPLEFTGVLTAGGVPHLRLFDRQTGDSGWLTVGTSLHGFTLVAYDAAAETATLRGDGRELRLSLPAPAVKAAPAAGLSTEATSAIHANLRLLAAAARLHFLAGRSRYATFDDLVGPEKLVAQIAPVAGENYRGLTFMRGETAALRVRTPAGEIVVANTATD